MNHHPPPLPMSCMRRQLTANVGTNNAREMAKPRNGIQPNAMATSTVKRYHHQYSARDARPLKSAYLLKQIFTASTNPM